MLLVRTELGASKIHGIGLFADETVAKGSVVWREDNGESYLVYSPAEWARFVARLSPETLRHVKRYTMKGNRDDDFELFLDNTRFLNHSTSPSLVIDDATDDLVADRDLSKGEELTIDYTTLYDPVYLSEILAPETYSTHS